MRRELEVQAFFEFQKEFLLWFRNFANHHEINKKKGLGKIFLDFFGKEDFQKRVVKNRHKRILEKSSGFFFILTQMIFEKNIFLSFSRQKKNRENLFQTKTLKKIQLSLLNEISSIERQPIQRIQHSTTILTQNVT